MSTQGLNDRHLLELEILEKLADEAIDLTDIPEITDDQWRLARKGDLYRPVKKSVTIRLDADVIEWFKEHASAGYQTEINSVLRRHVAQYIKKPA